MRAIEGLVAKEVERWAREFAEWYEARMIPAATEGRRANSELAALYDMECRLRDRFVRPDVVSLGQASAGLVKAAERKGCSSVLSWPDRKGKLRTAEDLLLDLMLLDDREDALVGQFYRGEDGKIHRNSNRDVDRLRARRRREDRSRGRGAIDMADEPVDAGAEDPAEAVATVHALRDRRDLQEECRRKGAKHEAAFERLALQGGSRRGLAEQFGTTEKAIRLAEPWVQGRLDRLRQRHAG